MALVITLILLSVTLIMAVAFLAISRRERSAVTTTTDTATARLAADAAFANAEAQIVVNIFATTNVAAYNFGLLVSTNYINGVGFQTAPPSSYASPTNVNYNYPGGTPVTGDDLIQNIANLFYLPRAPVYLSNLVTHAVAAENRFYLDLNRNGVDDPNGYLPVIGHNGGFLHPDGTEDNNPVNVVTNFQVGDPEWIGVLDHPDAPHGPNNKFVSRYAFIAVPVGNTLDINAIHNQAYDTVANRSLVSPNDEFFRNEGVGSWEINLAAFLADLNTNEWGQIVGSGVNPPPPLGSANYYQYNEPFDVNQGRAFDDALALLAYRYNHNYNSLASVQSLYPNGPNVFQYDNIDGYSDGPLMTNSFLPPDVTVGLGLNDNPALPWAGADNTNQFVSPQEFFDPAKAFTFVTNLWSVGTSNATYNRYTYYRMLDQLGSDSTPESGKINLNYSNAVVYFDPTNGLLANIAIIPGAETNFVPWVPTNFFMAAGERLLRTYTALWATNYITWVTNYGAGLITNYFVPVLYSNYVATFNVTNSFGITNIPVWVSNRFVYTPAVNRLLQLAANIYDATTTNYYPDVFRPLFSRDADASGTPGMGTNLFISGYTNVLSVTVPNDDQLLLPVTAWDLANTNIAVLNRPVNVYGVPWIIGAKKGFPNFNELYMESAFQLTRKIMVTRSDTNVTLTTTFNNYEMFDLSLTNQFGVECWNSYRSNYTALLNSGSIYIYVRDDLTMTLTNDENFSYTTNLFANGFLQFPNITNLFWPGYTNSISPLLSPGSFQIPLQTNFAAVPVSIYRFNGVAPFVTTNLALPFETVLPPGFGQLPQPHWGVTLTNNLRVIMVDTSDASNWKVIDYVQLGGPYSIRDLTTEIINGYDTVAQDKEDTAYNNQWDPSLINGVPAGITEQLNVSQGLGIPTYKQGQNGWTRDQKTAYDQMNGFLVFINGANTPLLTYPGYVPDPNTIGLAETTNAMQVPYTPTATVVQDIVWQVNDPLVHYTAGDLINPNDTNGLQINFNWPGNLGKLNQRYEPWGGNPSMGVGTNLLAVKDPLVYCSDNWNFPTNKFPTVGWLGRVHRGTPWQTVYLKASDVLSYPNNFGVYGVNGPNLWVNWTGDVNPYDAANSAPKKDWLLFDLFTTAFNDNATRGQLSVNVGGANGHSLAAWSALFSGIVVPTTLANTYTIINPAGPAGVRVPVGPPPTNNSPLCLGYLVQNGTNGINDIRATFHNPDGVIGTFEHVGYILSVPALTVQSPFLAGLNRQTQISDEMYEWLPQQVMSLLRTGSPRYVIYCYGQALKPAANSLVTGGAYFGMCTNYQVVAESAARAVVRVDGAGTPTPHVVVESYNPLPPD